MCLNENCYMAADWLFSVFLLSLVAFFIGCIIHFKFFNLTTILISLDRKVFPQVLVATLFKRICLTHTFNMKILRSAALIIESIK